MDRKTLRRTSAFQARIRMSEPVWRFITTNKNDNGEVDPLQVHLARLVHDNPEAKERILVTGDEDELDLLRDWCARMIAEGVLMRSNGKKIAGATLASEASRVVDLIDRYDHKLQEAVRVLK